MAKHKTGQEKLGETAANTTSPSATRDTLQCWNMKKVSAKMNYINHCLQSRHRAERESTRCSRLNNETKPQCRSRTTPMDEGSCIRSEIANNVKTCLGNNNPWSVSRGLRHQLSKPLRSTFNWATWDLSDKGHAWWWCWFKQVFMAKTILA